jgi:membrane protein
VIILLLWLYLSSFVVLLGAGLNAETERQTARDTTTGPDRPMGERGAEVAGTLGESPQLR